MWFSAAAVLSIVLIDGGVAATILVAATGLGWLALRPLGLRGEAPRWQLLLSAGLGIGLLALLLLVLGVCGVLNRGVWTGLTALFAFSCLLELVRLNRDELRKMQTPLPAAPAKPTWPRWLWLAAVPFLVLSLCAAACPPGYLWPAEGNGYDVLEYHFGAPKEYLLAGRIEFLPHNIYSNLPFNAEMLYLLSFVLRGSPFAGVFTAQMLNVLLGMLAVGGAWLAGREFGRLEGVVAGVAMATCPFLTYLSGVAYVENGMLAMTALSLACAVYGVRDCGPRVSRWVAASGLLAGFACGFKYTAIPLVAFPMLLVWLFAGTRRGRTSLIFVACAAAAFSPWMVKNFASTGNPVFPLARSVFHERPGVWTDEGAARWHEGHLPAPAERGAAPRALAIASRVFGNVMFGPVLFVLAALGLAAGFIDPRYHKLAVGVTLAIALGVGLWAATTHLVDRFAVGIIPFAALLAAIAVSSLRGMPAKRAACVALVAGAGWNIHTAFAPFGQAGVFEVLPFAALDLMRNGQWPGMGHIPVLSRIVSGGGRVMMLGDARAFYIEGRPDYFVVFNRNPFAEAVAAWRGDRDAPGPAEWLRSHGYSHLYIDWSEIRRLSRSRYGFWPGVADMTPDDWREAGLVPVELFSFGRGTYGTLFAVSPTATASRPSRLSVHTTTGPG